MHKTAFIRRAFRALLLRDAHFPVPLAAGLFAVWAAIVATQVFLVQPNTPDPADNPWAFWYNFAALGFDGYMLVASGRTLVRAVKVWRAGGRSMDVLHTVVLSPGAPSPVLVRTSVWIDPKGAWKWYETSSTDDPCERTPGVRSETQEDACRTHAQTVSATTANRGGFLLDVDLSK